MKVGVITFHRAENYGAVLQAYGLQTILESLGDSVELIDYRSDNIEKMYKIRTAFVHSIISLEIFSKITKKVRFKRFIGTKLKVTKKYKTYEQLNKLNDKYDYFITGSDQVWCQTCAERDRVYFLDFVNQKRKKNSYAASIGRSSIDNIPLYGELLSSFNNISVREESARRIIEESGRNDSTVHIDPTLLLTSNQWDLIRNYHQEKKPYILIYTVLGQNNLFDKARLLSKKTGLPIIYLNDTVRGREKDFIYKSAVSPESFVGYFAEADYVFTNSFHGTAFSIIYKKSFLTELSAKGRFNNRANELLSKLQLSERILENGNDITEDNIDWDTVDVLLDEERLKSINYLSDIF